MSCKTKQKLQLKRSEIVRAVTSSTQQRVLYITCKVMYKKNLTSFHRDFTFCFFFGIKNYKQLFSRVLTYMTKIKQHLKLR